MTEQSVRTRALIAAGKQVAHARGEDGTWRLEVFVDAVLAITEADKAEAVEAARQQALEGAAQAISANATRYTDEYLTTKAVASRLRRLPAEAGITVDTHTEEAS